MNSDVLLNITMHDEDGNEVLRATQGLLTFSQGKYFLTVEINSFVFAKASFDVEDNFSVSFNGLNGERFNTAFSYLRNNNFSLVFVSEKTPYTKCKL